MQSSVEHTRLARHVPVKGVPGVYYSENVKRRKRYEVSYTGTDGKRHIEVVGFRLDEAKARLAEVTTKKFKGETVAAPSTTVGELIEGWRETREVKASSRKIEERNVRLYIEPQWSRVRARDITRASIQAWLVGLKRKDGRPGPLSGATKRLILAHFSSILDFAVDSNVLSVNSCKTLARRAKPKAEELPPRILRDGELEALLAGCESREWLRDIIVVALNQALRLGEVVGLRWRDVDWENGLLRIERQIGKDGEEATPKGGVAATIDFMPEARKVLARLWLAAGRPADGPVFRNGYGGFRRYADVQAAFVVVRRRAGLSEEPRALRFHDLRHTAISRLANAPSMSITNVQGFARHANPEQTWKYVHKIESATWAEEAAEALGGLS